MSDLALQGDRVRSDANAFRALTDRLGLAVRLALRDLRGGFGGFTVFVACVALGVAAITAVGVATDSLKAGFSDQGRLFLGGDVSASLIHRPASSEQKSWFAEQGRVSEVATMRAMARTRDEGLRALIEIKAVDEAYPLVGKVDVRGGDDFRPLIMRQSAVVIDALLAERLDVSVGDKLKIGSGEAQVAGILGQEPDRFSGRPNFGPRVLMTLDTLKQLGLGGDGALMRWRYRIAFPDQVGDAALAEFPISLKAAFPNDGFRVLDRRNPSPGIARAIARFSQFLGLVGLTALMVGGVGVANAIATFVDRKRKTIATFKAMGASRQLIFWTFLLETLILGLLGAALGVILGIGLPAAGLALFGGALPFELSINFGWATVLTAIGYGLLVTLVFVLWPLGKAQGVKATVLFREQDGTETSSDPRMLIATCVAIAALVAFTIATAQSPLIAFYFCLGLAVVFPLFAGFGTLVRWASGKISRPRRPELALALGNMSGPGSLTQSVVLSLGVGLTLLISMALVDRSLSGELRTQLPDEAPSYFFLDLRQDEAEGFENTVRSSIPDTKVQRAPMLRGRLVSLKGVPVEKISAPEEAAWVLRGDRGITVSDTKPEGSEIRAGSWWEPGHSGKPLVSFDVELAGKLGIGVGDQLTINVLGRELTATIANLRTVKWESMSLNFVMVFSPNTMAGAPFNVVSTITFPEKTTDAQEAALMRSVTANYPSITAVRVKDVIERAGKLLERIMVAIRGAGALTILSGAIVLAGALVTAQRRRIYQSVILKALGATRMRIISSHMIEYGSLAVVTAGLSILLGSAVAYAVLTYLLRSTFIFSWDAVFQALALSLALVLIFGAIGTWRVLTAPSVPHLKSE